ncbi:MAG: insulinase family protein [Defluviitaleaceae bacterium]|nr:insulinase family protein [Defluviitaleaceae bacterium]
MNFTLKHSEKLEEIKGEGFIYEHKSGALLVFIKNDDKNKVFSATFRTPPKNDKGVPHIVEHTLLCGSEKYPVKDPFNELSKGSLYTFLNAMTFKDKTMYPIASCNNKDFYNLMDVYLDAVFNPLIRQREGSFLQEGVNYIFDEDDNFQGYGGIVYNEMQGAFSDPLELIHLKMEKELFSGTPYEFDSGGVPDAVKTLTYEEFLEYYDDHYTPANCIFYLYGDMDIEKGMKHISEYLSDDRPIGKAAEIKAAVPFKERKFIKDSYKTEEKVSSKASNYIGASYVMNGRSAKLITAVMLIKYYLLGLDASPLKQALMDGGFGDEIIDSFNAVTNHPSLSIVMKNSEKTAEEMAVCIDDVINDVLENGFDNDLLTACINRFEFSAREDASYGQPKGLNHNIAVVTDIISGDFTFEKTNKIKQIEAVKADKKYLMDVLRTQFANNNFVLYITSAPDYNYEETEDEIDEKTKAEYKNKMIEFEKYQELCDTPEDIDKIPMVQISDVDDTIEDISAKVDKVGDITVLSYTAETNGIVYMDFMYDTKNVPVDLLPYIGILSCVFGKLGTENYSLASLQQQIGCYIGGLSSHAKSSTNVTSGETEMLFVFKAKALEENADKIFRFVKELTEYTIFEDKTRLKTLIKEYFSMYEDSIINSGQSFAAGRASAYLQYASLFDDYVAGVEFYMFLKDIAEGDKYDEVSKKLKETVEYIFCKENFKIYIASNKDDYDFAKDDIVNYYNSMKESSNKPADAPKIPEPGEAFAVRSNVQYAALALDFRKIGIKYTGVMSVFVSILNKSYLLNEVRIKGGAYGCNCFAYKKGIFCFSSYRDPNIRSTIDTYKNSFKHAEELNISDKEMTRYILGTINKYIRPKNAVENVDYAITAFLNGVTHSMVEREVKEVLSSNLSEIKKLGKNLKAAMDKSVICVVGSKKKIESEKDLFTSICEA